MGKVYLDGRDPVKDNDQLRQSVNGRRHELPDPDTLINHLRLHPALVRRRKVSKGAREVLAWVEALALIHRRDDPTTLWLAVATGDSERQVARSLAELEDLGVIRVLGDGHNRRLRIAESMSPAKDTGGNIDIFVMVPVGNPDGNGKDADANHDKSVNVAAGNHDKNGRDSRGRVGFSESQKESKSQDSETRSRSFAKTLSEEERKKAQETWELFKASGSVREYEGLLLRCAEVGREECYDIAALQARIMQDRNKLKSAVGLMRTVVAEHLQTDKNAALEVLDAMRRNYETPAQHQEIDARERQAAANKAAHQAPPVPAVDALLVGTVKGMPNPEGPQKARKWTQPSSTSEFVMPAPTGAEEEALGRIKGMTAFDADQVRHIAALAAQQDDPAIMRLPHASPARKALIRRHLPAALAQWDQEQASKPPKMSREELRAASKAKK